MDKREEVGRESELTVGLSHLETDANNLCAQVKELRGKLSPVMRGIQPSPTSEIQVEKPLSPTGQHIKTITEMVNETAGIVSDIMQYLEV